MSSQDQVNKLLSEYGITREEVTEWAKKNGYEDLLSNFALLVKLYLSIVKHVSLAPKRRAPERKVSELQVGVRSTVNVVIASIPSEVAYIACPKCYRRVDARRAGERVNCPRCGAVTTISAKWVRVTAGDDTGEIHVVFPPRINANITPGMRVKLTGRLDEQLEFVVLDYEVVSEKSSDIDRAIQYIVNSAMQGANYNDVMNYIKSNFDVDPIEAMNEAGKRGVVITPDLTLKLVRRTGEGG